MTKPIIIIFLSILAYHAIGFSQNKGKIKDFDMNKDTVYVKGAPSFILESKNMATNFYIKSTAGKILFTVTLEDYNHASFVTSGNPKGRKTYWYFSFASLEKEFDMNVNGFGFGKDLAKYVVSGEFVKENSLNEEAVKTHVAMFGTRLSNERNRLQNNNNGSINNTIIINR